ncbi:hypothetical protein N9023_00545 [Opitutaceae bacterium]|nr:hypothetical protein [Opitutaceae bacterium]MDB4473467.1 hypothetical protein [Opitutaceae bacterium]
MKTSLILFVVATAVPFLTLIGLGVVGALSIMTALGVAAMVGLDYHKSGQLEYVAKEATLVSAQSVSETHPFAA